MTHAGAGPDPESGSRVSTRTLAFFGWMAFFLALFLADVHL